MGWWGFAKREQFIPHHWRAPVRPPRPPRNARWRAPADSPGARAPRSCLLQDRAMPGRRRQRGHAARGTAQWPAALRRRPRRRNLKRRKSLPVGRSRAPFAPRTPGSASARQSRCDCRRAIDGSGKHPNSSPTSQKSQRQPSVPKCTDMRIRWWPTTPLCISWACPATLPGACAGRRRRRHRQARRQHGGDDQIH